MKKLKVFTSSNNNNDHRHSLSARSRHEQQSTAMPTVFSIPISQSSSSVATVSPSSSSSTNVTPLSFTTVSPYFSNIYISPSTPRQFLYAQSSSSNYNKKILPPFPDDYPLLKSLCKSDAESRSVFGCNADDINNTLAQREEELLKKYAILSIADLDCLKKIFLLYYKIINIVAKKNIVMHGLGKFLNVIQKDFMVDDEAQMLFQNMKNEFMNKFLVIDEMVAIDAYCLTFADVASILNFNKQQENHYANIYNELLENLKKYIRAVQLSKQLNKDMNYKNIDDFLEKINCLEAEYYLSIGSLGQPDKWRALRGQINHSSKQALQNNRYKEFVRVSSTDPTQLFIRTNIKISSKKIAKFLEDKLAAAALTDNNYLAQSASLVFPTDEIHTDKVDLSSNTYALLSPRYNVTSIEKSQGAYSINTPLEILPADRKNFFSLPHTLEETCTITPPFLSVQAATRVLPTIPPISITASNSGDQDLKLCVSEPLYQSLSPITSKHQEWFDNNWPQSPRGDDQSFIFSAGNKTDRPSSRTKLSVYSIFFKKRRKQQQENSVSTINTPK